MDHAQSGRASAHAQRRYVGQLLAHPARHHRRDAPSGRDEALARLEYVIALVSAVEEQAGLLVLAYRLPSRKAAKEMFMNILCGSAGWADKSLIACARFYPSDCTSAEARLRFYASQFPLVE